MAVSQDSSKQFYLALKDVLQYLKTRSVRNWKKLQISRISGFLPWLIFIWSSSCVWGHAWLNCISWFALIQTSWNPRSDHANVRSKYLTLHNQVLEAETTYVQYLRSEILLLTPLCHWAHRSVRQDNMGALLIRPLCLQHIYRAMRWISQLGHSACFHTWFVG